MYAPNRAPAATLLTVFTVYFIWTATCSIFHAARAALPPRMVEQFCKGPPGSRAESDATILVFSARCAPDFRVIRARSRLSLRPARLPRHTRIHARTILFWILAASWSCIPAREV